MQCSLHPLYKGKKKQGLRYSSISGCVCDKIYESVARSSHMRAGSKTYTTWADMKHRCNNPDHESAKHYYHRGITYDESWSTFEQFYADMGDKPPKTHLDRIDNDKGYSKENCRWATIRQSQLNKRFKKNKDGLPIGIRVRGNKFEARVHIKYENVYLGLFPTVEDALKAREEWLRNNDN